MVLCLTASAYEGIKYYYVRYDVKASKNRILTDNLLMVPAQDDFRTENFSPVLVSGAISADQGETKPQIEQRIKEDSLKKLLMQQGLKSVEAKDHDTIISYEGAVTSPLNILSKEYNEDQNVFVYKIEIEFAPICFPDKWETYGVKNRIKRIFYDFFQLFQ